MNNSNGKTRRLAGLALFTAIVVVLQLLGSFIKFGPFAVSLVLIPTVLVCLIKGTAAGLVAGALYRAIGKKHPLAGVIVAAAAAPVVNTGLFVLAMVLFYQPQLQAWAGGTAVATYIVTTLVGVNFLLELGVNLVLSPTITRLIAAGKKGPVD